MKRYQKKWAIFETLRNGERVQMYPNDLSVNHRQLLTKKEATELLVVMKFHYKRKKKLTMGEGVAS